MAVRGNLQAKVPMLAGNPSKQATKSTMPTGKGMPMMSPGKPGKSIVGKPASTPVNQGTKQPKGGMKLAKGSIKGPPTKVANLAKTGGKKV